MEKLYKRAQERRSPAIHQKLKKNGTKSIDNTPTDRSLTFKYTTSELSKKNTGRLPTNSKIGTFASNRQPNCSKR